MFVARWSVDVRFGYKNEFKRVMSQWLEKVGNKVGMGGGRLLNGSIGALESRFENELVVDSLAELESKWAQMSAIDHHAQFGKELEPLIVSGSNRWEIFRVVDL